MFSNSVRHSALWILGAMALHGVVHLLTHGGGGGSPAGEPRSVIGDLFAMGMAGMVLAVMMTSTSHSVQRRGILSAILTLGVGLAMHFGSCPRASCAWVPGGTPAGPAPAAASASGTPSP